MAITGNENEERNIRRVRNNLATDQSDDEDDGRNAEDWMISSGSSDSDADMPLWFRIGSSSENENDDADDNDDNDDNNDANESGSDQDENADENADLDDDAQWTTDDDDENANEE